jgi:hypothetical protein
MERDEAPRPLTAANDSETPPIDTARIEAALIRIARLIGRQIAREGFGAQHGANDNAPSAIQPDPN